MNFHQLRIFISVAEHLNFTKAAEDFFTTQPTISRQIALLEEDWRIPLFTRNSQGVLLTREGEVMLQASRDVIARINKGLEEARIIREGHKGSVRIGCPELMDSAKIVRPSICHFSRLYPEIDITIEKLPFLELLNSLATDKLDIIFTIDIDLQKMDGIEYSSFHSAQGIILMSHTHHLAARENLEFVDFSDETFLLPEEEDSPNRENRIMELCRSHGFECRKTLYVKNMESVLLSVQAGKGVAVLDTSIIDATNNEIFSSFMLPNDTASISIAHGWKKSNTNPALTLYIESLLNKKMSDTGM